ncbi:hypothetical protein [Micromonospora sp. CPCC 206061]|uniref:hypothetical protein n=1 Tax=Micromonospora sp. CPCC 206061 TaxID=3122410 RepID=UPI002FF2D84C
MFKRYVIAMTAAAAAAFFALTGCAGDRSATTGTASEAQADTASATQLASAAARGLELDYDKLASPAAAVAASELIVRGTLVGVTDGISYSKAGQAGRSVPYVTLVIKVDSVLKGTAAAGSTVYAQLNISSSADAAQLAKAAQNLKVVAVLDDISGWTPAKGVTVVRPKGVAAGDPLYLAFPDGLWLQGAADKAMVGVHAERAEMSSAWGAPQTLDQFWAALGKAAK